MKQGKPIIAKIGDPVDLCGPMTLTLDEAHEREWPEIKVGEQYEFVAEVMEEYEDAGVRLRNYTGQMATVLAENEDVDPEYGRSFRVRFADGREATAHEEELNGWDKALGQFYGPSGKWGDPS